MLIEMNLRGVHVKPVDIYQSSATEYLLADDGEILPPLTSLPGVGQNAAEAFVASRAGGKFISQDDMLRRKVPKSLIATFEKLGCINDLPKTSQVTLFEFEM